MIYVTVRNENLKLNFKDISQIIIETIFILNYKVMLKNIVEVDTFNILINFIIRLFYPCVLFKYIQKIQKTNNEQLFKNACVYLSLRRGR